MLTAIKGKAIIFALTNEILTKFWPINFCGPIVQRKLIKKTKTIKNVLLVCVVLMGVVTMPIWINLKQFLLCFQVYEYYLGKWSKVAYYTFALTFPWVVYSSVRLPFIIIYGIVQIRMQFFLINAEISMINMKKQNQIFEKLRMCIKHHIMLKM